VKVGKPFQYTLIFHQVGGKGIEFENLPGLPSSGNGSDKNEDGQRVGQA
jgi:hypothetical protein